MKDVLDIFVFREDIECVDVEIYIRWLFDLDELVVFWKEYKRIGNCLELMRNSINFRLIECDENWV